MTKRPSGSISLRSMANRPATEYPVSVGYTVVRAVDSGPQHPATTTQFEPFTGGLRLGACIASMFIDARLYWRSPIVTRWSTTIGSSMTVVSAASTNRKSCSPGARTGSVSALPSTRRSRAASVAPSNAATVSRGSTVRTSKRSILTGVVRVFVMASSYSACNVLSVALTGSAVTSARGRTTIGAMRLAPLGDGVAAGAADAATRRRQPRREPSARRSRPLDACGFLGDGRCHHATAPSAGREPAAMETAGVRLGVIRDRPTHRPGAIVCHDLRDKRHPDVACGGWAWRAHYRCCWRSTRCRGRVRRWRSRSRSTSSSCRSACRGRS